MNNIPKNPEIMMKTGNITLTLKEIMSPRDITLDVHGSEFLDKFEVKVAGLEDNLEMTIYAYISYPEEYDLLSEIISINVDKPLDCFDNVAPVAVGTISAYIASFKPHTSPFDLAASLREYRDRPQPKTTHAYESTNDTGRR